MTIKEVVPLFVVGDVKASIKFYVDGLGFVLDQSWKPDGKIRWCHLQLDGAGLMLQQQQSGQLLEPTGSGVSLYFMCEDAVALYRQFQANGLNPREPFVGNSMWVTSIDDPDGYNLNFESPTDVSEETRLSDTGL